MKKFFLLALTIFGCQTVTVDEGIDCSPDYTYAESMNETWNDITYALPWCWTSDSPSSDQLILKDGDSENQVFMHYHEPDPETLGHVVEKTDPAGETFYLEVTDLDSHDIQIILNSITFN